jgi:hypothetical protein
MQINADQVGICLVCVVSSQRILNMAENAPDPFGTVKMSQDLLAAQQKFLPSGKLFTQMSEAIRIVSAAQMEYGQALMRAHSVLFGTFLQPAGYGRDIRPSEAVHQPDCAA